MHAFCPLQAFRAVLQLPFPLQSFLPLQQFLLGGAATGLAALSSSSPLPAALRTWDVAGSSGFAERVGAGGYSGIPVGAEGAGEAARHPPSAARIPPAADSESALLRGISMGHGSMRERRPPSRSNGLLQRGAGGSTTRGVNKWAVRALLLLLAIGATVGGVYAYRAATRPPEISYHTVKLERGGIVARVSATGTLSAHVTVQVGAQVSGRLSDILVDFNSLVKKGQVIARLDPALFQASLASAHANTLQAAGMLSKSRATLENNKMLLERAKKLHDEGLMSQQDFDTASANVNVAKGDVDSQAGNYEQARAQEHQAEINLAYCTIISPIDGTVISRNVDVGQTVAASLSAPVLFTIAEDLHKMQVDTNVTEGDVGKLLDGQRASFVVDAYPNDRFNGIIHQIRNAATTVQNVVTYDAVIEVENPDLKLRPGMTANVTVNYDRRENALRVPNSALRFRPPPALAGAASAALAAAAPDGAPTRGHGSATPAGGSSAAPATSASAAAPSASASARPRRQWGRQAQDPTAKVLWVQRDPKLPPVPVPVKVGLTDGTYTEIVSGDVQEGDAVVTEAMTGDEPAPTGRPGGNGPPRMRL